MNTSNNLISILITGFLWIGLFNAPAVAAEVTLEKGGGYSDSNGGVLTTFGDMRFFNAFKAPEVVVSKMVGGGPCGGENGCSSPSIATYITKTVGEETSVELQCGLIKEEPETVSCNFFGSMGFVQRTKTCGVNRYNWNARIQDENGYIADLIKTTTGTTSYRFLNQFGNTPFLTGSNRFRNMITCFENEKYCLMSSYECENDISSCHDLLDFIVDPKRNMHNPESDAYFDEVYEKCRASERH